MSEVKKLRDALKKWQLAYKNLKAQVGQSPLYTKDGKQVNVGLINAAAATGEELIK
jgi:hypothetical protein